MTKVISLWRMVVSVGWARSGTWSNICGREERTYIASLHIVKRDGNKALSFVIGPASLIIGLAK